MALFSILQWNSQGLLGHGHELLNHLQTHKEYDLICVQETWFHEHSYLGIPEYTCLLRNREGQRRGGCAIYVHDGINYEGPINDSNLELQQVNIYVANEKISIINFYNPCKR